MSTPTSPAARASAAPAAAPESALTYDVIVLGGGPAGVATALEVALRGHRVLVLERQEHTGGMAGSFVIDGMRVDHGSHRLHPVTPPGVMDRLTRLLGDDLQVRRRHGRLRLLDRWVDFPLRPAGLARAMPKRWLAAVARDVALSPLRSFPPRRTRSLQPDSYASSLRSSLGPAVYDTLYAPYAEKLWGLPGEDIDPEQARVRVSADTVPKVAARVLRTSTRRLVRRLSAMRSQPGGQDAGNTGGATFNYPRRGFGQIVEALDDAARAAGAEIRTAMTVESIEAAGSDGMARVHTADGSTWQAPRVFSTLPIPLLARLSDTAPPSRVIEDAKALRFRAMVLVYLTHQPGSVPDERSPVRWSAYDAHYLPGAGTPITRISEPANYRDNPEDPTDYSVICAEIPCVAGDQIWTADDDDLVTIVQRAAADFDLPPLHAAGVQVRRLPAVYPIYDHGFSERLARLEDWAASLPGITTLGRSGLFAHDNTHHAFVMAQAAAHALDQDGTFDEARWLQAREAFREHVVED